MSVAHINVSLHTAFEAFYIMSASKGCKWEHRIWCNTFVLPRVSLLIIIAHMLLSLQSFHYQSTTFLLQIKLESFLWVDLINSPRVREGCILMLSQNCGVYSVLKGIVHPKMKILSSFTHPQVVPNLFEFLCSAEHKGRYFEERL